MLASARATMVTAQFSFAVFAFSFVSYLPTGSVFLLVPVSHRRLAGFSPDSG
jgi:hypothetical protein